MELLLVETQDFDTVHEMCQLRSSTKAMSTEPECEPTNMYIELSGSGSYSLGNASNSASVHNGHVTTDAHAAQFSLPQPETSLNATMYILLPTKHMQHTIFSDAIGLQGSLAPKHPLYFFITFSKLTATASMKGSVFRYVLGSTLLVPCTQMARSCITCVSSVHAYIQSLSTRKHTCDQRTNYDANL